MKQGEETKLVKRGTALIVCLLVATQLVGCGWYMRPGRGGAPLAAGPSVGDGWNGGRAGGPAYADAGATDSWEPDAGYGDTGKTRLRGVPTRMLDTVYFDFDKSNIRPDQLRTLERNLAWIQRNPDAYLRLEGHCDERGTEEYNLALGDRRADTVRNWLIAHGVPADHLESVSKGELEPAVLGHDESAWSKNRRVEFLILE